MSLRTAVGVILLTLAGLYLVVVPLTRNIPSPFGRAYVPHFFLLAIFGIVYVYVGRNDEPTRSP